MAWEEVTMTPEEIAAMQAKYFKWEAIGDTLGGVFVRMAPARKNQFGKDEVPYVFRIKNADGVVEEVTATTPYDADVKLKKAQLQPGFKVLIKYTGDQDVGKANPMKVFSVKVDRDVKAPAKPAPAPAPKQATPDDIDF